MHDDECSERGTRFTFACIALETRLQFRRWVPIVVLLKLLHRITDVKVYPPPLTDLVGARLVTCSSRSTCEFGKAVSRILSATKKPIFINFESPDITWLTHLLLP